MTLIWKLVPSEPRIEAANNGWLRQTDTQASIKSKTGSADHYPYVRWAGRKIFVHHLVCEAFHGQKPALNSICRHLDDDPSNTNADNLAWGTKKDNYKDMVRNGSFRQKLDKGTRHAAKKLFAEGSTVAEVAKELSISPSTSARIRGDMTSNMAAVRIAAVVLLGKGHEVSDIVKWLNLDEPWMKLLIKDVDKWDMQGNVSCQNNHQKRCAKPAVWISVATGSMVCDDHLKTAQSQYTSFLKGTGPQRNPLNAKDMSLTLLLKEALKRVENS